MAAFNKFDCFLLDTFGGIHNLNTAVVKCMLTNTLPVRTNTVKANITQLANANGYVTDGNACAFVSLTQTLGAAKLILSPPLFTAVGGSSGPFQYAVLMNSSQAAGNLIGWYDYGVPVTITNGNSFQVNLDQVNGVFSDV